MADNSGYDQESGFSNHIVILGWSERVARIISHLRNNVHRGSNDIHPIVVVTEETIDRRSVGNFEKVYFLYGRSNSTKSQTNTTSDGGTVFSLLAALSIRPDLQVCVEMTSPENGDALEHIVHTSVVEGDVEVVSLESFCEKLLAQAAINRGITRVYNNLLSFCEESNEIYVTPLSPRHNNKSFRDLFLLAFERQVILLGYERDGEMTLNPKDREVILHAGDLVWFMSYNKKDGLLVFCPEVLGV
jgi:Castor and Pollux, part of voltage-gated ion channel